MWRRCEHAPATVRGLLQELLDFFARAHGDSRFPRYEDHATTSSLTVSARPGRRALSRSVILVVTTHASGRGEVVALALTVALTTAEELRVLCDCLDRDDKQQREWVLWQAELLGHWAQIVAEEVPEFPSLADGLGEFALAVQDSVRTEAG